MVYETVQGKWKMKMENRKCLLPLWYSVFFFLIDVCFSVFVKEEWAILFYVFQLSLGILVYNAVLSFPSQELVLCLNKG